MKAHAPKERWLISRLVQKQFQTAREYVITTVAENTSTRRQSTYWSLVQGFLVWNHRYDYAPTQECDIKFVLLVYAVCQIKGEIYLCVLSLAPYCYQIGTDLLLFFTKMYQSLKPDNWLNNSVPFFFICEVLCILVWTLNFCFYDPMMDSYLCPSLFVLF